MTPTMKQFRRQGMTAFVALLTLTGMTGNAWARSACLKPRAAHALQTAAVQQKLMVAALTCKQTSQYNRFVITYRTELRRSDAQLKRYFRHHGGEAGYHAYKTRLANAASLESLHGIRRYCTNASMVFHTALDNGKTSLTALVEKVARDEVRMCEPKGTRVAERDEG